MSEYGAEGATIKRSSSAGSFIQKYFMEGQLVGEGREEHAADPYRRLKGVLMPAIFFHLVWWSYMIKHDLFHLFEEKYYMTITMVFGSMIAGATSEGGASVAFPVMTLAFAIKPAVARDFSFMIQSCGMTAAMFTIFYMGVMIEKRSFTYCSLGGFVGMIFGLEEIAPRMTPAQKKIGFVSIWFAFAFSLFWLNRNFGRHVHLSIQNFPGKHYWRAITLLVAGFIGGVFSSVAGSGIDICSFATLTLLFRISEKVATPTSVCLMAVNTVVGFAWRQFFMGGVEKESWEFLAVCVPVVVFGAPFGSVLGSYCHRLVLAAFVYVTDTVQIIAAYIIVNRNGKLDDDLIVTGVMCIVFGALFFTLFQYAGLYLLDNVDSERDDDSESNERYAKSSNDKTVQAFQELGP
mmetsp:Transcript_14828/g.31852  ORF Transcript_14828/g.31852 Transcript_14828/m.31852 type:complete len:405 (-) Transcript_14828:160-1374(-)|eukprot:CAMPEP_0118923192 /NCGR_PEP_ID=MMETSP1169-20130426/1809_1 /TAXON_ID=36882 /ORGANISM="Pyramimonas obovata, Strain CCMP722" /LENGTH=404 /DNA_ID=CAMNT_0006864145 /DNA_START=108 /DNA_END=1322 /DNA_ORIENTATION=-